MKKKKVWYVYRDEFLHGWGIGGRGAYILSDSPLNRADVMICSPTAYPSIKVAIAKKSILRRDKIYLVAVTAIEKGTKGYKSIHALNTHTFDALKENPKLLRYAVEEEKDFDGTDDSITLDEPIEISNRYENVGQIYNRMINEIGGSDEC